MTEGKTRQSKSFGQRLIEKRALLERLKNRQIELEERIISLRASIDRAEREAKEALKDAL
jgi:uncharacterized small protein (DUF1192 family)